MEIKLEIKMETNVEPLDSAAAPEVATTAMAGNDWQNSAASMLCAESQWCLPEPAADTSSDSERRGILDKGSDDGGGVSAGDQPIRPQPGRSTEFSPQPVV